MEFTHRSWAWRGVGLACLLWMAACPLPAESDGEYRCSTDAQCATGWRCTDGVCTLPCTGDACAGTTSTGASGASGSSAATSAVSGASSSGVRPSSSSGGASGTSLVSSSAGTSSGSVSASQGGSGSGGASSATPSSSSVGGGSSAATASSALQASSSAVATSSSGLVVGSSSASAVSSSGPPASSSSAGVSSSGPAPSSSGPPPQITLEWDPDALSSAVDQCARTDLVVKVDGVESAPPAPINVQVRAVVARKFGVGGAECLADNGGDLDQADLRVQAARTTLSVGGARVAGVSQVVASVDGLDVASLRHEHTAGPAVGLRVVPPAGVDLLELPPGACVGPLVLEAVDAYGNRAALEAPVQVDLRAPDGLTLHATATCALDNVELAFVTLSPGGPSPAVYVRTQAGQEQDNLVMGVPDGSLNSVQGLAVTPPVLQVAKVGQGALPATRCSQAVVTRSHLGQPVVLDEATGVSLGSSQTSLRFYADACCAVPILTDPAVTMASGAATAQGVYVLWEPNTDGQADLTASATGHESVANTLTVARSGVPWWNGDVAGTGVPGGVWCSRQEVTVAQDGMALTGSDTADPERLPGAYSLRLVLDLSSVPSAQRRFVLHRGDATVLLPHAVDVEAQQGGPSAAVWVRWPDALPAGPGAVRVFMYTAGPPTLPSQATLRDVFLLFDDFEGATLDPSRWTTGAENKTSVGPCGGANATPRCLIMSTDNLGATYQVLANLPDQTDVMLEASYAVSQRDVLGGPVVRATGTNAVDSLGVLASNNADACADEQKRCLVKFTGATRSNQHPVTTNNEFWVANTFYRVSLGAYGSYAYYRLGGVAPPMGAAPYPDRVDGGKLGFRVARKDGHTFKVNHAWARRFMDPEPVASLGAQQNR